MKVWVARAVTEAADHYTFVFSYKPSFEEVIKRVSEIEGQIEDLDFYFDTTGFHLEEEEIITK